MSRQTLDDLGATRLDDVLDYVGGVSRQNNFGGLWDNIAIRGLPGNENTGMATLLNGFRPTGALMRRVTWRGWTASSFERPCRCAVWQQRA